MQVGQDNCNRKGIPFTWREIRRIVLDRFAPPDWWPKILQLWRESQVQGSRQAVLWLTEYHHWSAVINKVLPGEQTALSDAFQAVVLRGGVSSRLDEELTRRQDRLNVFDPVAVADAITEISSRYSDGLMESRKKETAEVRRAAADTKARDTLAQELGFNDHEHLSHLTGGWSLPAVLKLIEADNEEADASKHTVYAGAIADFLHNRRVSEETFNQRKKDDQCVCCGQHDHRPLMPNLQQLSTGGG